MYHLLAISTALLATTHTAAAVTAAADKQSHSIESTRKWLEVCLLDIAVTINGYLPTEQHRQQHTADVREHVIIVQQ